MAKTVSKDMIIADILQIDRGIVPILMESGMHCLGCPSAQGESLAEACSVHGIDVDPIIDKINTYLSK
ncbi:MAG: disulfide oxidoreductase [Epulopiscium sp. Nele67-Bin002]|nr:MAG: disulfide oxidoreductase [Epulopiscium sp. Nuni2H_MBin001]OON91647.1 MAG: disulfide oxidoreductase [Epulopiscium sp. Nele67-Bin002]OON92673.1 MAG: disulfide oxidoreductase [Epulopiscium sp. Nele67-Bin001]